MTVWLILTALVWVFAVVVAGINYGLMKDCKEKQNSKPKSELEDKPKEKTKQPSLKKLKKLNKRKAK